MKKSIKTTPRKKYLLIEFMLKEFNIKSTPSMLLHVERILKKNEYPHAIFDIRDIDYIDSIGIGFFISIRNIFKDHEKEMAIVCDNNRILQVFENVNMNRFCNVFKNIDEAEKFLEINATKEQ